MLLDQEVHDRLEPAALVCSLIAEVYRDPEKRKRPYEVSDFLPGGDHVAPVDDGEPDEEMKAFIDAINRGEKMEQTPESLEAFKGSIASYFKPATECGKTTLIGPSGKMEKA